MAASLKSASALEPKLSTSLISDRIHPDQSGAIIPAVEIACAWGLDPVVCRVKLDLSTRKVLESDGTSVRKIINGSWEQKDEALPCPYNLADPLEKLSAKACNLTKRLNRYIVSVVGVPEGIYNLSIDGKVVLQADASRLSNGVDLGDLPTPMFGDAEKVLDLVRRKNQIQHLQWREVERPYEAKYASAKQAISGLRALELSLTKEIENTVRPKWRRFSISRVIEH
jgi:hypothetical protein